MALGKALYALLVVASALMIAFGAHAEDAPPARREYVIAGSGSGTPIVAKLAAAYRRTHPEVAIDVPRSIGSTGGIRALRNGAIDLAVTIRLPRSDEFAEGVTFVPFAKTPLVLGAHPSVPDTGLTREDVTAIFAGTKTRWRDGHDIVVLMRDRDEAKNAALTSWIPALAPLFETAWRANRWRTLFHDDEMIAALHQTPYSIGVTDWGSIRLSEKSITALALDHVAPTPDAVRRGHYPLSVTLYFAYRGAQPDAPTQRFLAFVFSADARALLESSGYLPLQPETGNGP